MIISHPLLAAEKSAMVSGMPTSQNQCLQCHPMDPLFSHPVNVVPSMAVPASLPLTNGQMTCNTCHDGHGSGMARIRSQNSENPAELCGQCHDRNQGGRLAQHGVGIGQAHLQPTRSRMGAASVDQTRACLSCHDGLMATDTASSRSVSLVDELSSDHPVGVSMERRPDSSLHAPESLDTRIRLFDRRVGCGSCHSPYSKLPNLLVMSNVRSRLCLNCHQ